MIRVMPRHGQRRRHPIAARPALASLGLAATLCVSLGACTPGTDLHEVPSYDPHSYVLGVDDQIRVITYDQDQLSTDFRVDAGGKVAVPTLGNLQAAGLTTAEFAAEMTQALEKQKLLRHPSVVVEIVAYRPVSILGEVARPGEYPYRPGMTLLTAIAASGGYTYRAFEGYAYVVRQEGDHTVTGRLSPGDFVKPGDAIQVYERHF
ncbi:polysaccharide export outer membrane protein [Endobacter medicaginis]|uniref:Polysaccharide export outer membrane protein n=2 Tax=Endobacter medicaginis TaxID=1181271 RepID=A0A839V2A9_9PROT|nr:polysaccharide biosynthesis/export family protein [Endobacter medicaginis]MBB3174644.1 polysaccharide export outer membrane protein [Endobacter medicaginis]MCX5474664.1 polysaccharide export protein [Endobacter medicaginis]